MSKKFKKIEIDQRSDESVYITMGDWIVYLDNSTNEKIIDSWTNEEYKTKTIQKGEDNEISSNLPYGDDTC